MAKSTIPDKRYFRIGEVARIAEVATHVLRYWESEFPLIRPKRANSKQRLYRREDVELILKVKTLLHEHGYTISGAKKLLAEGAALPPSRADDQAVTITAEKLRSLKNEIRELQDLLKK